MNAAVRMRDWPSSFRADKQTKVDMKLWSRQDTRLLISIWGDASIQDGFASTTLFAGVSQLVCSRFFAGQQIYLQTKVVEDDS